MRPLARRARGDTDTPRTSVRDALRRPVGVRASAATLLGAITLVGAFTVTDAFAMSEPDAAPITAVAAADNTTGPSTTVANPSSETPSTAAPTTEAPPAARPAPGRATTGPVATTSTSTSSTAPANATANATTANATGVGFSSNNVLLTEDEAAMVRDLDLMAAAGASWLRLNVSRANIEATRGKRNWEQLDRVVDAAAARRLRIIGVISYTPAWDRPPGTSWNWAPADPTAFADFAGAAAARYAGRVAVWEVWNEPNLSDFWAPRPDPAAYVALLAATTPRIRAADQAAHVLFGGLAGVGTKPDGAKIAPDDFLRQSYRHGAKGQFDAVAAHPYAYPYAPMDPLPGDWNGFVSMPKVHDVMAANGDGARKVWVTEFGYPTGTAARAVPEATQADYVGQAVDALRKWDWAGPMLWYSLRDKGGSLDVADANFGLVRADFTPKPGYAAWVAAAPRLTGR